MRSFKGVSLVLVTMIGVGAFGACASPNPKGESLGKAGDEVNACVNNTQCNEAGGYVCNFQDDPTKGTLVCDAPSNQWVTQCSPGRFCDATVFTTGCNFGMQHLRCDLGNKKLVVPMCGDGVVDPGESCDDGNNVNCDGCRADCSAIETGCGDGFKCGGEACDDGNNVDGDTCEADCTLPKCANGIIDPPEQCDDGNMKNGDSCESTCMLPTCGNGILDIGEQCDDGNNLNADGCESNCKLGFCGNGILDPGEACDDGNNVNGDGCQGNCQLPKCGDGIKDPTEECDDGNNVNGDGCSAACKLPKCGDGFKDPGEQCDDGNVVSGDGCQSNCKLPKCGDGFKDPGEQCDDGNNINGDTCEANCTLPLCGNGKLDPGEQCDDHNLVNGDGCDSSCKVEPVCPAPGGSSTPCINGTYGCSNPGIGMCTEVGTGTVLQCKCPDSKGYGTMKALSDMTCTGLCWQVPDGGVVTTSSSSSSGGSTTSGVGGSSSSSASSTSSSTSSTTSTGSGMGMPGPLDYTFIWTPDPLLMPDTTPGSKVRLWGFYTGYTGLNYELCDMTLSGGSYRCTLSGLSGLPQLEFNVHFSKATSGTGECWIANKSTDVPCGHNGSYFGGVKSGLQVIKGAATDITSLLLFHTNHICQGPNVPGCPTPYDNGYFNGPTP